MSTSLLALGQRGAALIKGAEQVRLTAYLPTDHDIWTIGFGHTSGVHAGMTIDLATAEKFLQADVAGAVVAVNALGCRLSQSAFDALVSLVFNAGSGTISPASTIGGALLAWRETGDRSHYFAAWRGFALWTKQAGSDLRGLAARRAAEMSLCMEDQILEGGTSDANREDHAHDGA